jgi:glycine/D-amino acid oxidase-like deaminating enzyme
MDDESGRVVIVGGGILGTMHAVMARRRGLAVTHLEREQEGRGASVRNFGLVWVSGRRAGPELALALRARELWAEIADFAPGTGFRPHGSLTIATSEAELDVMREAAALPDAKQREFELLSSAEVRAVNPALQGEFLGGLYCPRCARPWPALATSGCPDLRPSRWRRTGCGIPAAPGTGATSWYCAPARTSPASPGRT